MIHIVRLNKLALKQLKKLPRHIVIKLMAWVEDVEERDLESVRPLEFQIPGFHDEPLLGTRKGQRSIRLSKQYRAIYEIQEDDSIQFVEVQEVNKHEY